MTDPDPLGRVDACLAALDAAVARLTPAVEGAVAALSELGAQRYRALPARDLVALELAREAVRAAGPPVGAALDPAARTRLLAGLRDRTGVALWDDPTLLATLPTARRGVLEVLRDTAGDRASGADDLAAYAEHHAAVVRALAGDAADPLVAEVATALS
ncbi:MAG: hypothetical protein ACLGIR_03020 [Actinomycetes bacterium]